MKTLKMSGRGKGVLLALAAGCALFAWGCAGNSVSTDGGNGGGASPQVAAALSVCDPTGANCQTTSPGLSASTASAITFAVDWTNVPVGTHTQEIRMVLPNGDFYQRFDGSFLISSSSNGQANLSRLVAIAGTPINERLLTGTWNVQVLLDGQVINSQNLQVNP